MSAYNMSGSMLIRENTPLPADLAIDSEVLFPSWRIVKNLDALTLARNIEAANWNFFYLAGGIRASVLGRGRAGTLRRAVKRVLAKQKGEKFNSLEITKVVLKRFLGIPFMTVTAFSRHIQQGIGLVPAMDLVQRMPIVAATGEVATMQHVVLISSS
jgi:hypothetical protein